ncbi:hypothetical protein ACFPVT_07725 [Corynebacterium choanae]|uniref:Uncharacterized protein n=1 Tax=Corynebacterium choanae TaxID=1862358 RepID=A0A3G6J7N8_9CORY|nr:hypothetical protein [Corynebacterium choanae]AZA13996.1 hypothetical protein CCHOA_08020 [Corynebacterium choanae]
MSSPTPTPPPSPHWWPLIAGATSVAALGSGVAIALNVLRFSSDFTLTGWVWQVVAIVLVCAGCYEGAVHGRSHSPAATLRTVLVGCLTGVAVSFFAVGVPRLAWILLGLGIVIAFVLSSSLRLSIDESLGYHNAV